ncbi:MAG: MBL fold metallo-hydrolase [Deltaproteobacteria bacterium]|nr:MBL fold metallo-hydrolase [Deltaproteobacteria bacterium]
MKISKMGGIVSALSLVFLCGCVAAQGGPSGMFAKMPPAAFGPVIDQEKGYFVEELGRGLYHLNDGAYQMMFLTTGEGVIVVDAPPTTSQNILAAISSVTDEPITHVIYSHSHKDHIGVASLYPRNAIIIAHEVTSAHLARKSDPDRPIPTQSFTDSLTLEVGSQTLQLDYHGVNHLAGNIYVYAAEQKVLMLVDVVFPGWTAFPDLAITESVDGFLEAHDIILGYDFEHYIGGHLTRRGTREDVEIQKAYFADIVQAAAKANSAMDFGAAFGEAAARGGQGNPFAAIKVLFDNVARQCADEVEKKWGGRLGAVDIFTFDHCWKIAEHQRVD